MTAVQHRSTVPRFLVVGFTAVAIDAVVYASTFHLLGHDLAKGAGYIAGAVFGYVANWKFTFGRRRGRWSEVAFVAVYASSLALNIAINGLVLSVLPLPGAAVAAFLAATGVTTVWNYLGMSYLVFARGPRAGADR